MLNKVTLIGNLGADPDVRYLPSGEPVANLRVATTERYKDKAGVQQEETEWHRVSFFGKQAEVCGKYLKKGSQVYIEGKIKTRKWQDNSGQDQYTTEIKGSEMKMLGGRSSAPADTSAPAPAPAGQANGGGQNDDIPFAPLRGLHF